MNGRTAADLSAPLRACDVRGPAPWRLDGNGSVRVGPHSEWECGPTWCGGRPRRFPADRPFGC